MKHIIVCRVNIPRELDPTNHVRPAPYKDPEWNRKRVHLLDAYTRKSLRNQTCQDFDFVTLWGPHYGYLGKPLPQEKTMILTREWNTFDSEAFDFEAWRAGKKLKKDTMDFAGQVRFRLRKMYKDDPGPFLITNIDSDDALKYNFVERIQRAAPDYVHKAPYFLDVVERYLVHLETGGKGVKKRRTASPMVSTVEKEIECYPLKYHHSMLHEHINGTKIPGLYALQTVGDTNILTQGTGENTTFEVEDFL